MIYTAANPGDRVRLTPKDETGPIVEGYVTNASYNNLTIRGLGFTQFQSHDYDVEVLETGISADVLELSRIIASIRPEETPEKIALRIKLAGFQKTPADAF